VDRVLRRFVAAAWGQRTAGRQASRQTGRQTGRQASRQAGMESCSAVMEGSDEEAAVSSVAAALLSPKQSNIH
jgi:hypothetical protein